MELTNIAALSLAALLLIWLGYPAGIWLAARLRPQRRPARADDGGARPTVSVIVASKDDAQAIRERVLDALRAEYPAELLDVVVARDALAPDPAPFEVPGAEGRAVVVRGDEPGGKACALNAAVSSARGEILVFTDTAQRFAPDAIPLLVAALRDARLGAVSGALQLRGQRRSPAAWYWYFERWLRSEEARVHSPVGVTGAIYAMRRRDWRPLPAGVLCDDLYVPMDLVLRGHRIGFETRAHAFDERRFEAAQEYQRKVRTLTGVLQVCFWLPAVLVPLRNPVWVQFVCHKLLRLLTPYLAALALVAGVAAVGHALGRSGLPALPGWVAGAAALGVLLLIWIASRRARAALAMGLAMQVAVVRATWNGLRGEWDVWRR